MARVNSRYLKSWRVAAISNGKLGQARHTWLKSMRLSSRLSCAQYFTLFPMDVSFACQKIGVPFTRSRLAKEATQTALSVQWALFSAAQAESHTLRKAWERRVSRCFNCSAYLCSGKRLCSHLGEALDCRSEIGCILLAIRVRKETRQCPWIVNPVRLLPRRDEEHCGRKFPSRCQTESNVTLG